MVEMDYMVEDIASIAHEANRQLCAVLGDPVQPPWEEAPDWQRASAVQGVLNVIQNPGLTPEDSHNSWLAEKTRDGWRYGPVKDPVKKTHPCYRPYGELPPEQQRKDHLFIAVVQAMHARLAP